MTEIHCPTCERLLVRTHADGSFDLAGQATIAGEVPIPVDIDPAGLPIALPTEVFPLSARCLRCHPPAP